MVGYIYDLVYENSVSKHVVNIALYLMSRGMKPRDLLLRRYWRREDDGSYGTVTKIFMLGRYGSFQFAN